MNISLILAQLLILAQEGEGEGLPGSPIVHIIGGIAWVFVGKFLADQFQGGCLFWLAYTLATIFMIGVTFS